MSIAIYRKYRPKSFSEVTGQPHIKVTLQNEIAIDKVAHAYLFCGPRGTGKTTIARLLSKSVNCLDLQPNGEPCNKCANCLEFIDGKSMDIIEIDAASHTGVENVRENIIHNSRFTPTKSKFKIFIIDEVHMLSTAAFNALLKTLEEPPKYIIFILATTEAHKVPATIVSRCQRFDFKKIVFSELTDRLRWIVAQEGVSVDDSVLKQIARQSGGCVRDAESLLEQVLSIGLKNISAEDAQLVLPRVNFELLKDLFSVLVEKKTADGIQLINRLINEGIDITQFTEQFVEFVRKVLIYKITNDIAELAREFDDTTAGEVVESAKNLTERDLVAIIEKILSTKEIFKQNFLPQLALEVMVVELTAVKEFKAETASSFGQQFTKATEPINQPAIQAVKNQPTNESPNQPINQSTNQLINQSTSSLPQMSAPDMEKIMSVWPQFMEVLKKQNYSLSMSVSMAKPIAFSSGILVLGFPFELQRSRSDTPQNRLFMAEILTQIFNEKIMVENRLTNNQPISPPVNPSSGQPNQQLNNFNESNKQQTQSGGAGASQPTSIDEVANMFGGTVVS